MGETMVEAGARAFKEGMRRLAASVCLITTAQVDGARNGLTATAVCSLSADPPTLLCCLNRSSNSFSAIVQSGTFCVNVVSEADADVAHHFAGARPAMEKFTAGEWTTRATGAPVLVSALASFDCDVAQVVEVGTHGVLIGAVRHVGLGPGGAALLYAEGGYGGFTARDAARALGQG